MNNTMRLFRHLAALVWLSIGFAVSAQASLIGDTVSCAITPTPFWQCDTPTAVVGAGHEFELFIPTSNDFGFNVDLDASSVTVSSNKQDVFGLGASEFLTLSDLDWVGVNGVIVGITNFSTSAGTMMSISDVTFNEHAVFIDMNNTSWTSGSFYSFDLATRHSVPEPTTLFLIGFGLAGIGCARKKCYVRS